MTDTPGPCCDDNWSVYGCRCAPTNVLYWELSDPDPEKCSVHSDIPPEMMRRVNELLVERGYGRYGRAFAE